MNKYISSIIIAFLCSSIAFAQKSQLAIFVYNSNSNIPTNALRSQLTTSFLEGGNSPYDVVDRTDEILTSLRAEYLYQGSGMVKDEQIISIGEHLAANFICAIAITEYPEPDGYFFEGKIIDVAKRQIIKNALFPNDAQTNITSLSIHNQLEIGKELSKQLSLLSEEQLNTQQYKLGAVYQTEVGSDFRIGYLDETGKHGIAYRLDNNSDFPSYFPYQWCEDYRPTIGDCMNLYKNKDILGLNDRCWTGEREKKNWLYTFDFRTKTTELWKVCSGKYCRIIYVVHF